MNKHIVWLFSLLVFVLAGCEKDEIDGTATEALAGEWYVTVDAVDEGSNVVAEDCFGLGYIHMNTYNTAADTQAEMYVDDLKNFWDFKVRVSSDVNAMTFATNGAMPNESYEGCDVTIDGGKILLEAATTPHGTPADSIVYYVSFSDYEPGMRYKVSGYRYTGLAVDD